MRGITLEKDSVRATAAGVNELKDRIILLTRIDVHYEIDLPPGADREKVDRALATHQDKCPTARSLEGAVEIAWTAEIRGG